MAPVIEVGDEIYCNCNKDHPCGVTGIVTEYNEGTRIYYIKAFSGIANSILAKYAVKITPLNKLL
jgi:hypothetical protein